MTFDQSTLKSVLISRDLKPANCLIQTDDELGTKIAKVTDFGASKISGSNKARELSMTTNMVNDK